MSKQKAVDFLVAKRGCSQRDAEAIIADTFEALSAATQNVGDRVMIRGFGTFTVKLRKARDARNPATGEIVRVEERQQLAFKAAK